jgi:hypothetical protein
VADSYLFRTLTLTLTLSICAICVTPQLAAAPANTIVMSTGSNIGAGCGAAVSQAAVQQDLEQQLRTAGMAVSKVHSAQLLAEIDCLPVASATGLAIHQCLSLTQVVSPRAQGGEAILATTWRKCQAYTCGTRQCDALVRTGMRDLANVFIADSPNAPPASEPVPPRALSGPGAVTAVATFAGTSILSRADAIYYVLYILACGVVFVRWQLSSRHAH